MVKVVSYDESYHRLWQFLGCAQAALFWFCQCNQGVLLPCCYQAFSCLVEGLFNFQGYAALFQFSKFIMVLLPMPCS